MIERKVLIVSLFANASDYSKKTCIYRSIMLVSFKIMIIRKYTNVTSSCMQWSYELWPRPENVQLNFDRIIRKARSRAKFTRSERVFALTFCKQCNYLHTCTLNNNNYEFPCQIPSVEAAYSNPSVYALSTMKRWYFSLMHAALYILNEYFNPKSTTHQLQSIAVHFINFAIHVHVASE